MITAGSGPYLTTLDGRRVLDATAGATAATGDRVLLGYDWNPASSLRRAPLLPVLPPAWERPAERQLADDLAALLGWEYAVPAASGPVASAVLYEVAVRGWWATGWSPDGVVEVDLAELSCAEYAGADEPGVWEVLDRIERSITASRDGYVVNTVVVRAAAVTPVPVRAMRTLRRLATDAGLILGWDETKVGLGRSGAPALLSSLPVDVRPDVAAIGDSLAAGHGELGAVLCDQRLLSRCRFRAHDFGDIHPLAAAIGTETLPGIIRAMATATERGDYLRRAVAERLGQHAVVTACGLEVCVYPEV
ncbi:aminotransferase class III-fold pyridoxal phosphate-dependent enzyme [Murinocardiopsis flavida]|uniref:aminotransferase class III-fold pyridoxal phosphate-dependent enzyme n=1 Tax=Murinocardiopsis flavida TaxID=645275 RepID=UPI0014742A4E|nr:aminotransferase class III-fold pyridoxal phosphate-dependent enzyme [Murinocardiopsis flavida]